MDRFRAENPEDWAEYLAEGEERSAVDASATEVWDETAWRGCQALGCVWWLDFTLYASF